MITPGNKLQLYIVMIIKEGFAEFAVKGLLCKGQERGHISHIVNMHYFFEILNFFSTLGHDSDKISV